MTPFLRFLDGRLDQLIPHLRRPVELRVALHRHPGVAGVMEAAANILQAIPGVTLVDLKQPAVGLQSVSVGVLPAFKRELQLNELDAARDAGIDALVTVYHSEHRELCAHERDWPFRIVNLLELVGAEHGAATPGSLQGAQDHAGCRPDHRRMRRPDRAARARRRARRARSSSRRCSATSR